MSSKEWGPKLWYILHLISFNYPENPDIITKRYHHDFFENLKNVIPCVICRNHYKNHLENNPISPHLDNKYLFSKWVVNLHNQVNIMLGKPIKSYEEVVIMYSQNQEPKKENSNYKYYISISVIILSLLYFLFFRRSNLKNNYRYT
jgi:hypothetical protein